MRINTNVSAMNAANNLNRVQNAVSSSMEKLSSGFRINHASDDAAGLGIANKLRADGRALSQASRNAEQTNSLLQVAEGATSTIQSILERMKELATQSGSDTVDAAGRQSINAEFNALRDEITRTVSTTKFEGSALLDGTFGSSAPQLATTDVTYANGSTALAGAYTMSVTDAGIATLNRPAGAVPPTYTVDLTQNGAVSYSNGKASITFGSGTDAITVAATATGASDISGIQAALDAHGFTTVAAVASQSSSATSNVAGMTAISVPASQATGTLHFSTSDATFAQNSGLTVSTYVKSVAVGATQVAGSYDVAVTAQNAQIGGTNQINALVGVGGTNLAVASNTVAGTYTVKENVAGDKLQIFRGGTQVGSDIDISSYDGTTDLAVNTGGISFTIKANTYADKATFDAAINGNTGKDFTVTGSASLTISRGGVQQGSAVDLSSFDGSSDVVVNQGGIQFTIDKSIGANAAAISSVVNGQSLTVSAAKINVLDGGNTVLATQSLSSSYSNGSDVVFSNASFGFTLAGGNGATNSWANIKTALSTGTMSVTHTAAHSASTSAVSGNASASVAASFLVDASGSYKTSDMIQLQALNLTVSTLGLTNSDLSSASGARNALSTIDSALGTVSTALGSIGANQNRISYAQDNLKTKIANFSAAESVIRDVDMADEMTKFSKNNILAQAGTAMLAQANQAGQSVLTLLRG
jgi:flagellin